MTMCTSSVGGLHEPLACACPSRTVRLRAAELLPVARRSAGHDKQSDENLADTFGLHDLGTSLAVPLGAKQARLCAIACDGSGSRVAGNG